MVTAPRSTTECPKPLAPAEGAASIALVLPCYDPPAGWAGLVRERYAALTARRPQWHWTLVIVDDGNQPGALAERSDLPACVWIALSHNRGKGAALRAGVKAVRAERYVFTDVDFPFADDTLLAVADALLVEPAGIFVGVRPSVRMAGAPMSRWLLSWALRLFNRHVLGLAVEDTQCGLKGFGQAGRDVFLEVPTEGYLFDLDFLRRAQHAGGLVVGTVEVAWRGGRNAGAVGLGVLARECLSLLRIMRGGTER